jgi:hypothetical protein
MKKLIPKILLAALALLASPLAQAQTWTYNDGDLLLIFRKTGHNNIEFDLGSVTNYLGKTNGFTTTVTGWDLSLVTGEFGSNLKNVNVILLATSGLTNASPTVWLTSPEPNTTAYNDSGQEFNTLSGLISAVGKKPINPFQVPYTEPNAYVIDPGDPQYGAASFDHIASINPINIPQLGGNVAFTVQQPIPGLLDFWAIKSTGTSPNPPDLLVGTFTAATNGVLTFVAGPRPSTIIGVNHSGNISTIQFTTTVGNSYSVVYTNTLGGATATWPVDGTTLVGDGRVNTINRTSSDDAEFYRVNAQ